MTRFLLVISSTRGDVCSSAASSGRVLPPRQDDILETVFPEISTTLETSFSYVSGLATGILVCQLRLRDILVSYFMQRLAAGISMPEIQSFDNLRSGEFKNIIIVLKIIHKFFLTRNDYFVKKIIHFN